MNRHIITISVIVLIGIALLIHFTCKEEPIKIIEPEVEIAGNQIIDGEQMLGGESEEIKEINIGRKRLRVQIR